jgi:NAD(P)-dependent dehydrogenase (short-subunit alcohol dehydrogenase family)
MPLPSRTPATRGIRDLTDRVAVVTGAASGIGRAVARGLRGSGCHLALLDVDAEGLASLRAELAGSAAGRRTTAHQVDVGDRWRMEAAAREVVAVHGAVHVLVNNAGIAHEAPFPRTSLEDWDRIIDVNLRGVIHGCHFFLPHLAKVDRAHIVNISSLLGIVAVPGQTAYCTTKFAVRGLTESLREELRATSIGVTLVHPGAVATDIMRRARGDDPELMERLSRWYERNAVPPERVGAQIIRAIRRGTPRLLTGVDVGFADLVKRLLPVTGNRLMSDLVIRVLGVGYMRARRLQQWHDTMVRGGSGDAE